MREIKFRAWHPTSGMTYFDLSHIDAGSVLFGDGDWRPLYDGTCEVMQYIGIEDKNHKGIYEGDIVEYDGPEGVGGPWRDRKIVDFTDGVFGFKNWPVHNYRQYNLEVVGNIFENPEKTPTDIWKEYEESESSDPPKK
jgi:hypothetical protein